MIAMRFFAGESPMKRGAIDATSFCSKRTPWQFLYDSTTAMSSAPEPPPKSRTFFGIMPSSLISVSKGCFLNMLISLAVIRAISVKSKTGQLLDLSDSVSASLHISDNRFR